MAQSQFSLTWESHVTNLSSGLSCLQQNGEFVDMTLAADGHMVKVHQVVLALASPYIKDIITNTQCPHPVIFLNKISYTTLSALLEYIYTGETLVSYEHLSELIEAARDLHIKGLKDMNVGSELPTYLKGPAELPNNAALDDNTCFFQVAQDEEGCADDTGQPVDEIQGVMAFSQSTDYDEKLSVDPLPETDEVMEATDTVMDTTDNESRGSTKTKSYLGKIIEANASALQYTVSNQGSLQMILNRFIYYLKYTNKDKSRQWRCVDYLSHTNKCSAYVITKDDIVVQRIAVHTHPFHDKRILKKLKSGDIFTALVEAEMEGSNKRRKLKERPGESDIEVTE